MAEVGEPGGAAENFPAGRASASSADEESAVSGSATAGVPRAREPKWLQPILRMMAETHRELANCGGATKPKHGLATLRLDEFRGGRETTTH